MLDERNPSRLRVNMGYGRRVSYQLSLIFLVTQKVIRTARHGFGGEWRKSRGLRGLAGSGQFSGTVEMCGKISGLVQIRESTVVSFSPGEKKSQKIRRSRGRKLDDTPSRRQ